MKMKWKINSLVVSKGSKLGLIKSKGMYYMGGVNILPPPLKPDEEKLLIDRLEKDDSVKTILIERNLRLVVYISRKFENTGIEAVNTFKSNKNIKLATYASRCIENEILMYLRKNNKKKAEVSFDEPLNTDLDGNELLLSDVLGTENDEIYKIIEEEIDKNLLFMALDKLSDREKQIMELRFGLTTRGNEKTQKEVASILGISQSYISRLEKKIISRLKKEMKKFV